MSSHSNIQTQNENKPLSNLKQTKNIQFAHSQHPHPASTNRLQYEWVAAYIDGQYFLTDPESMTKLKNIEAEIQQEKERLAKLQYDNISQNGSFLTYQQKHSVHLSNNSFCESQFNQSKHLNRKQKYKGQLENEQDKYKQNLRNMQKKKSQMKQSMQLFQKNQGLVDKPKDQQSLAHRSQLKSIKPPTKQQLIPLQNSPIISSPQKSARSKQNSHHKSRIQKSIRQNSKIQQIVSKQPSQANQNSVKIQASNQDLDNKTLVKSQVESKSLKQSVSKKGQKQPTSCQLQEVIQQHNNLVNTQQNQSPKTHRTQSRHKSIKQPSKHSSKFNQLSAKNQQINPIQSVQAASSHHEQAIQQIKNSGHPQGSQHSSKPISNTQNIQIQVTPEREFFENKSHTKSHKTSTIKARSQSKRQSQKIQNQSRKSHLIDNSPVPVAQSDARSKKSSLLFQEKAEAKSKKSDHLIHSIEQNNKSFQNPLIVLSQDVQRQKHKHQDTIIDTKSKKSHVSTNKISQKEQPLEYAQVQSNKIKAQQNKSVISKKHSQYDIDDAKTKKSQRSKKQGRQQKNQKSIILQENVTKQLQKLQPQPQTVFKSPQDTKSIKSDKIQLIQEIVSKKSSSFPFRKDKSVKQYSNTIDKLQNQLIAVENAESQLPDKQIVQEQKIQNQTKVIAKQHKIESAKQEPVKIDRSIQWSRMSETQQPAKSHINQIRFQASSSHNSSFINLQEQSMNQSSHLKLQQLNNQLKASVNLQQPSQEVNMKKRKEYAVQDNQSEKKSKSFVIHSRNGSVKQKSEKNYDRSSRSKVSSKRKRQIEQESVSKYQNAQNDSVTKDQILKLHDQIHLLQEKLKKVQERQQQIQKLEGTISKLQLPNDSLPQPERNQHSETQVQALQIPLPSLGELNLVNRIQPKLQLQSSIIQVNTTEELRKKQEKDGEMQQKNKLQQEISRLKKIIRDMQIDKIKSIDHDSDMPDQPLPKQQYSRQIQKALKDIQKQSSNLEERSNKKQIWTNSNIKSRQPQEIGKIIHNNAADKSIESPRKKATQRNKYLPNDDDVVESNFPEQLNTKNQKIYNDTRRQDIIDRFSQKDSEFHQFVQSSRVIAQDNNKQEQPDASANNGFTSFSKIGLAQTNSKINYSRMVEQMKKNNPEQEQVLPQIQMRDIKAPTLPNPPQSEMTQQELLQLAKATYKAFGRDVDKEEYQLCVKKYKNCVVFTINNAPSECVLWHFSGKFYMGGWKSGEGAEGEKHGEGVQLIPDKHLYRGQFLNGKKHGTGIIRMANGNLYDGQWVQGVKNGHGVYFDAATKVVYSGEWKEGKKDGHGLLKLSEKEYYYGTFVKSIKDGFGSEVFINGDKYKGEYKNGKFHGKGKYTWLNGSCYEGQFHQGVRHGQGSWKSAKLNGDIYIGTYQNDKKNGYGRYVWVNGCVYQGGFANDVKHGKGRLTYQDGKEIKGIWQDGNLLTTDNDKNIDHEDQPLRRSIKPASFHLPSTKRF